LGLVVVGTMEELLVGRSCQCLNRCQELVRSGEAIPKIQVIKVNTPLKRQVQPCKYSDDDFLCRVNVQGMWCTGAIIRRKWFTAPEIPYNLLKCPPSTRKAGPNEDIHVK